MKGAHTLEELRAELCKDEEFRKEYRRQRPYYSLLVEVIKRRAELGLTQEQLAELAGTTQSCISRIESGEHNIQLSTLINIAEALGASVDIHLVDSLDEGDYTELFKTRTVSVARERREEYTVVSIDHKVAETKWHK